MENSLCFFALLLLILCSSTNKPLSSASTPLLNSTTNQNALLAFKNTITWDSYGVLAKNWSTNTSVCNWIGVSCGIKHQRVTALNISGFALSGTLPPHLGNLTFLKYLDISSNDFRGPIPSELSRLYRLREIDMGANSFTGEIPSWFGSLTRLEQLRLDNNTFSGRIPEEIGNCSSLQILNLNHNQLTGSIPYGIFSLSSITGISIMDNGLTGELPQEFGNLALLDYFNLSNNSLSGSIPSSIFNISTLKTLNLNYNKFSGRLPTDMCNNLPNLMRLLISANQIEGQIPPNLWKCRELEILSLSHNRFNGEIPSEIGSLSMLRELYLEFNNFKGPVPKKMGNCTSLMAVDLSDNYLTGEFPQELGNLKLLEKLVVFNNSLSGPIPSSIFNISTLKFLQLSYNQFSGNLRVPSELSLPNLEVLRLHHNELSGEIPSSITNASKLTRLGLSSNSFSGSVPNFGNLGLLQTLRFWDNNLSGAEFPSQELGFLSSLTHCRFLEVLQVSGNPLNGILPASIGNLSTSLRDFVASECNITGVIPNTIGNLSSLLRLILPGNQLIGLIPKTIGKLKQLQVLYLYGNRLHGYIPPDLCQLVNIGSLYMNDNILTGPIPECLGEVRSLRGIYLDSNKLNSTIPSNFWNLRDLLFVNFSSNYLTGQLSSKIGNSKVINELDLSHNQFSGNIPRSIGGCQMLGFLSLSNNKLDGSIPPSLGNLRSLSSLDLSNNNLSGSIPESLAGLNLLQYFNVSNNKLEGEIPTGGHFDNFTAQSFFNNSALCGAAKLQVPHCITRKNDVRLTKYILPPFILAIILATIIIFLLVRRLKLERSVLIPTPDDDIPLDTSWRRVSYIELVRGTNGFNETNLLGKGSFGSVFKATLSDGLNIAVKVFNLQLDRAVRSFDTECEILSNIRHRNLVQIIGCCSNTQFKALILGYMPNGSLEKWLYSDNYYLDLLQSLEIAIDVASALEYLHHGHTFPVVHCDIKPSNVLLNEDMVAHLADFGISKLFDDGETMVLTNTLATIGYTAPEYGSEGKVSTNGDVYSYGILLLEIFTKKKPTDDMFNEEMSLKEWVHDALQENDVTKVVAPDLLGREAHHFGAKLEESVSSIFRLAMRCLVISPNERINMIETTAALQKIKTKVVAGTTRHQNYALSITTGQ